MTSPDVPVLMDAADMAARLGVSTRWLAAETAAGRVPCLRAGKRVLYDPVLAADSIRARIRAESARGAQEVGHAPRK